MQAYERGVSLFKWPHVYDIWNTYLTKFMKRYVSSIGLPEQAMGWLPFDRFGIGGRRLTY